MKITSQDVLRVAELAHLELSPAEIETYRGQLDEILTYIGKLNELDVSAVEPMAQVTFAIADSRPRELRDDVVRDCHTADAIFPIAPDAARPFFRVPKVIEK